MFELDKISNENNFKDANPLDKLIFSISMIIINLIFDKPLCNLITILMVSSLIIIKTKIKLKKYLKILLLPVTFLFIGILTIAVVKLKIGDTAIISLGSIAITNESLKRALQVFLRAFSCITTIYFLVLSTPLDDIIYALEKMKLPKIFIEIMNLCYRFIFILMQEFENTKISQESRMGYSNLKRGFSSLSQLISSIFLGALFKSDKIYTAMESRLYTGEFTFISKEYNPWKQSYLILLLTAIMYIFIEIKF